MAEKKEPDARLLWVEKRVFAAFGLKRHVWEKFKRAFETEENSLKAVNNFLDDSDTLFILFQTGNTPEVVVASVHDVPQPSQMAKRKSLLMLKAERNVVITSENVQTSILCLEVTSAIMEMLHELCGGVYLSTLSNPANQVGLSQFVTKDILEKYSRFLAKLHATLGVMSGRTLLPTPPEGLSGESSNSEKLHLYEDSVIMWTKQIRLVLEKNPAQSLNDGQNPEPAEEMEFWEHRAANLDSISEQLGDDAVLHVQEFLHQNKSTYSTPFEKLRNEVEVERKEARDNVKFLSTLKPWLMRLMDETIEFTSLDNLFEPILQNILLIWEYSEYYNTPARLVVLMRQICNAIIAQAFRYISGQEVFKHIQNDDPKEALCKLGTALTVCNNFKKVYLKYRSQAEREGCPWQTKNEALFLRLDTYRERNKALQDFTKTVMQFNKLEKIEICGTKGSALTTYVLTLFEEFKRLVEDFQQVDYDVMDVDCAQLDDHFYRFRCSVKELEQRLASVLTAGFDDSNTILGRIKLFESFGSLLERPIIKDELEKKHALLLQQYKQDVKEVQKLFRDGSTAIHQQAEDAPCFANQPPVAGALFWARALRERAEEPMQRLLVFSKSVQEKPDEFKEVEKQYHCVASAIQDYEEEMRTAWGATSVAPTREKLADLLLRRTENGLLKVNFDPALTRLMREVKYLELQDLAVPEGAREVYAKFNTYRRQTDSMEMIVSMYNQILTDLLPNERPLLADRIAKINAILAPGLTSLRWHSSEEVDEFLSQATSVVTEVYGICHTMKANLQKIIGVLASWAEKPLFERKPKPMSPDDIDQMLRASIAIRHHQMSEEGKEIHKLLRDSADALKTSKGAPQWRLHGGFVNSIVIQGFAALIVISLKHLCKTLEAAMHPKPDVAPLFEVKLELVDNSIDFVPSFDHEKHGGSPGIRDLIDQWIGDFFKCATTVARLDTGTGDYLNEVKSNFLVMAVRSRLTKLIGATRQKLNEYLLTFEEYSFLWKRDIHDVLEEFLSDEPRGLVENWNDSESEPFHQIMEVIGIDLGRPIPALSRFDEKITYFQRVRTEISNFKTPCDIFWIRINAQPTKIQLSQLAAKWANQYTSFLHDFCVARIDGITGFINKMLGYLDADIPAEDDENTEALYNVMTNIRDVKIAIDAIKTLFVPIREQVALLKKHGCLIAEERLVALEAAPAKWEEVIRKAFEIKEAILPMQMQEMTNIKQTLSTFSDDVQNFRDAFLRDAPFRHDFPRADVYKCLDEFYKKTLLMESKAKDFNNLEMLFDMARSGYRQLKDTFVDLRLLKQIWDVIDFWTFSFDDWKSTLWGKIVTDELLLRVKDMQQQLKALPKEIKSMRLFSHESERCAAALGPEFCLEDLLKLRLHEHADGVSDIVVLAQKEAKIDKKLQEITSVWRQLALQFNLEREDVPLLEPLDDVIEVLEQHAMDLMTMVAQGNVIDFCRTAVEEWQDKLRTVDSVLKVWMELQKKWRRLQPIFMLSEDIRSQLPEDSKRFEAADGEWRDLMFCAAHQPNIVETCHHEGRFELLVKLRDMIEVCEKALSDYLEQKKKAFARFYFVSNQALLDILANGNDPLKVCYYLGDCFDGIKTLDFQKDPVHARLACGMYSKEDEYVPFGETYRLEGPVETYLANLETHVRKQLRDILEVAKANAENWEVDKPREEWLRDYCAQIALVASQIIWTDEVSRCFEELEGGSENAMKDYKRVYDDRIEKLIRQVQQDLTCDLRVKIITLITIDVHARDVVESFINKKLTEASSFQWQSQLRFYWAQKPGEETKTCIVRMCDWSTTYMYEYVGNCGRLVITPLTDRCYITLTQALNLMMGGAPAGPAGTGKTETTKDLSRAIGLPVFVFNCSDQMNYLSMAQIFMGLAQSGAWGCFDEFNRISIEVLSVVSTQVKSVLDAIKEGKKRFQFMDEEINLIPTCGFFITMNPGYAGRTELPENLKALFRSCAMIVPDVRFICENMLMSEGFINARALAHKFVTLYSLCNALLSKAMHYDWGLRAVKAVLRQAGALKRADTAIDEDVLLMRALRDFNIAKITTDDKPIFLRLIEDLFPGIQAPSKRDADFWKVVTKVTKQQKLQAEEQFVLKCVQLREILSVRHCLFVLGPPGCSKSCVWKTLNKALVSIGEDAVFEALNPKAISANELYGHMTATKEWRDGAIAVIMRNMSKERGRFKASHRHKWIVLDGNIDAEWIESMNTVMDDNKVLTLVSNERIPFTSTMRMLFEVADMKHASPATVSRGGVLFINESDVGWKPFLESWRETLPDHIAQSQFYLLFSYYFEQNLETFHKSFKFICPMSDIGFVESICCFIDAMLYNNTKENTELLKNKSPDEQKFIYEAYFIVALMWTIGGCLADDKLVNYRNQFNSWLRSASKIKFPEGGLCFDYKFDEVSGQWTPWAQELLPFEPAADTLFTNIIVSTVDTVRMKFVADLHVRRRKPLLFVGTTGTGKTTVVKDYLRGLPEEILSATINLNSYTDSKRLQGIIESHIEKRTGHSYGPAGNKRIIFYIDDFNMPFVDKYDTQPPLELLRQLVDYGSMFDRERLDERKHIVDVQYVASMNPTAATFHISSRLQRHFSVLACFPPESETITRIYGSILRHHLLPFDTAVQNLEAPVLQATIDMFQTIHGSPSFVHSAKKFHYTFSLRDLSLIFQGVLQSRPAMYRAVSAGTTKFARLWMHESCRVIRDRLVNSEDAKAFDEILGKTAKKFFPDENSDALFKTPNVMTSFVSESGGNDRVYLPIKNMEQLKQVLDEKLQEYSKTYVDLPLVLFDDAMEHVARMCRVIDQPGGNALLVGVGGSGKQSLSRLAAFISKMEIFQVTVNQHYDRIAFKTDLQELLNKAAVRPGTPHAFLLTDQQIIDEGFLVFINDLLASGNIPDLFTREEMDTIFSTLRKQAKAANVADTREALNQFFTDKLRRNLHVIICHSPVGETLRSRARKFPAIVSGAVMDQFHPWPRDALVHVALRFIRDLELPSEEMHAVLAEHMASVHLSVDPANQRFFELERRHNYTTPKSFLALIEFYKKFLSSKRVGIEKSIERLQRGLTTLQETRVKVEGLREDLQEKMVKVDEQKAAVDLLIDQVTKAAAVAEEESKVANEENEKANEAAEEASAIQKKADEELSEAMPAMERAREAVKCLTKPAIQELKALGKPPAECMEVTKAVLIMRGELKNTDWKASQKMMNDPGKFLDQVRAFDAENMTQETVALIEPIISQPFFNFDVMKGKSLAAAYLANWVVNIVTYNNIYRKVKPLMDAFAQATESKQKAEAALAVVQERVKELNDRLAKLNGKMQEADEEKGRVLAEAQACQLKLDLAERLVNGLADENTRWTTSVEQLEDSKVTVIGDALLASAFVSYVGAFTSPFRVSLIEETWKVDLKQKVIPFTEQVTPLEVLADEADMARWKNDGLPADRTSIENAAIVTSCSRWPLLIDPQLQGVKWIKQKERDSLVTVQMTRDKWLAKVLEAMRNGEFLLIEAIGEEIDAILDPLLSRAVVKKGRTLLLKIAGEDVELLPSFMLVLQTKLANPHYKPEIAAQCTVVNFTGTPEGLEEQILALIVNAEQPELEHTKRELVRKQNEFKVTLAQLEDALLVQLSNADPATILSNTELVEGLETTKQTATEIQEQAVAAKKTEAQINESRETYRDAAAEAAMLYFLLTQLWNINPMYQYSLDSFVTFLYKAIDKAEARASYAERCVALVQSIRKTIFTWVARGLFERHKLTFVALLTFRLLQRGVLNDAYDPECFNFLLRGPSKVVAETPLTEWLPNSAWYAVQKLIELPGFEAFATNMERDAPSRFREWFQELQPEAVRLPLDWKRLDSQPFKKLLVLRCLRPDRMTTAIAEYIKAILPSGSEFIDGDAALSFKDILESSFKDSANTTPIFFILSPGADPVKEVEALGRKLGYTANFNFHNIAMGQGQDTVAMQKLDFAQKEGHWVMLQNIHLMPRWTVELEKKLDAFAAEGSHPNFRCFLSSDPCTYIPIGILERAIKLTNEPPQGLKANFKRAFAFFSRDDFDERDQKIRATLFGLCFFHAVMLERKKFGSRGWNMTYPFSIGDLRDSALVLFNYIEAQNAVKVPWDDLKYIFGEIMYGGHIIDVRDRLLCTTYLDFFMQDRLLDEAELFPFCEGHDGVSFKTPPPQGYERYLESIEAMPQETPLAFGLHPNAEIGYRTQQCNDLFTTLLQMQPRNASTEGGAGNQGVQSQAEQVCRDILEELGDCRIDIEEVSQSIPDEEKGPYQHVFLQECQCMNVLITEVIRSLNELEMGFKGELTTSAVMEDLAENLVLDRVPPTWTKLAFPSTRPLGSWLGNLKERLEHLQDWTKDPLSVPKVVDLSKLFNPQSFLTAIKEVASQQHQLELNKLTILTTVTKKDVASVEAAARDGAFVTGLYLDGARWDAAANCLEVSRPKELFCALPVIHCKAAVESQKEDSSTYICPVYRTQQRGATFIFNAQLRTKYPSAKWIMGGVAMILDVGVTL
ncbi:dynein heavy chain family protein [Besnoitia besnoiti]|uniref:Dynein heavy chain family protein n=1 Tax=Besnoitia besnoiti TaxID=94643 RepID=A0A2A9MFY9_BESBE|nr:dynein heavy chain family protein [Besnoitia besnoiti]PFH34573.1 dynein heavy chain family protein [Besnoitia besnoiti]